MAWVAGHGCEFGVGPLDFAGFESGWELPFYGGGHAHDPRVFPIGVKAWVVADMESDAEGATWGDGGVF